MAIKNKVIEFQNAGGPWKPFTPSSPSVDADEVGIEVQQFEDSPAVTSEASDPQGHSSTDDTVGEHVFLLPSESISVSASFNVLDTGIPVGDEVLRDNSTSDTDISIFPQLDETTDPALFAQKRITPAIISLLINSPFQPDKDYNFVKTAGRSFLSEWFRSTQPDKTWKSRTWLSYSTSTNSAFCTTCLLFGGPTADNIWTHQGYRGWECGHGLRGIERHEASAQHRQNELTRFQWVHVNRVDQPLVTANKLIVDQNRRVMYIAVKTMKFLATEMTAVLGHTNRDGKFMHLFREFSEFDPCAAGYLQQLAEIRKRDVRSKPEVNLLSPLNCRRLLQTMKTLVVHEICSQISHQKAFSIIIDGTQDLSKKDAQAVLVRYISTMDGNVRPVERLLEVFTTGDSSGQGLFERVVPIFRDLDLKLEWIIGQSYDGASNMSGKYSGLQARLRALNKKALYVWCKAHRFNLLVEGVLKSSPQVTGTISLLQELYNFFVGYKRNAALAAAQKDESHVKTLKRVSETTRSWRSVDDGVAVVLDRFQYIITALEELSTVSSYDAPTVSSAYGLLRRLQEFDIIVTLFMLRNIFMKTGPVSRLLQGVACDYGVAASLLQDCVREFDQMRDNADNCWTKLITEAKLFALKHDIEPNFPTKRQKRTKRMPGEVVRDERSQDPEVAFKVNTYIPALVSVQNEFRDRFTDMNVAVVREMQCFTPRFLLSDQLDPEHATIQNLCNLYDLDATSVARELAEFRSVFRKLHTLISIDDLMPVTTRSNEFDPKTEAHSDHDLMNDGEDDHDVEDDAEPRESKFKRWADQSFVKPLRALQELSGFPALSVIYKILVSLAITSSSAERAMSRVRLIKNRLRTTMLDDWFSSCMILASEKDIVENIPVDRIIDQFAILSTPLQKLLIK